MDFEAIWNEAHEAGMRAGEAAIPRPMIVGTPVSFLSKDIDYSQPTYYVSEGVCGFAWVTFPGNTAWARWAKKYRDCGKAYPKGLQHWVGEFDQSMARKEAYARAFASVLKKHGIKCHAGSRMD